jgi:multidrug resistance efflux pump
LSFITATANASGKKEAATLKSVEMEEQSKIISAEKAESEATLAEALLGLETARLALGGLDESDITAVRLQIDGFVMKVQMLVMLFTQEYQFDFGKGFCWEEPAR